MPANTAPTFNVGDGIVNTDLGSANHRDYPASLLVQSDGRLIVVGHAGWQFMVDDSDVAAVRYNADGSLDTSFGSNGKVLWDAFGWGASETVAEAKLLADGKILIVGNAYNSDAFLARLNSDGSPDTSFGSGGIMQIATTVADSGDSLTVLADNSLLIAGTGSGSYEDFALTHVLTDGTLDPGFGTDGMVLLDMNSLVTTGWGGSSDSLYGVTSQPDGKIIAVGRVGSGPYLFQTSLGAVVRFNADGSLDTNFGDSHGVAIVPLSGTINPTQAQVLADGKILVVGINDQTAFLTRFNSDGTVDTAFGPDGTGSVSGQTGDFDFDMLALQTDGSIILAGGNGFVSRYSADGILDTAFGTQGTSQTGLEYVSGVSVLSNGKIAVAGSLYGSDITPVWAETTNDFAVVCLNTDGTPDTAFGADSTLANSLGLFTENSTAASLDDNIQVYDTEMATAGNYGGASVTLMRHGGPHTEDQFSAGERMGVLTEGANLYVDDVHIGQVEQNSGGTLTLSFNTGASQTLIDTALQQIRYSNNNDSPPAEVQIDWAFSDGSLTATDNSTVRIHAVNDAPSLDTPGNANLIDTAANDSFIAVSGALNSVDADNASGLIYGISNGTLASNVSGKTGTYGTLHVNITTGAYLFTPDDAAIEGLKTNASETFAITVTDNLIASPVTATFTVNLSGTNDLPVLDIPLSDQLVTAYGTLEYTFLADSFSDRDDNDTLSYDAHLADGATLPSWLHFDAATRTFSATPDNRAVGSVGIEVTATDGSNTATSDRFILIVAARHKIVGTAAAETLYGTDTADTLIGGAGADTLRGGAGDDIYVVGQGDRLIERALTGTDLVKSNLSWALGEHLEHLTLIGTGHTTATGNALANRLTGNVGKNVLNGKGGNDTLSGGAGQDSLTGGHGADRFVFDSAPNAADNVDRVLDFVTGTDKLCLDADLFRALGMGSITGEALTTAQFHAGKAAHDSSDRMIYDKTTGKLYYDADGTGHATMKLVAILGTTSHPTLHASDILVLV